MIRSTSSPSACRLYPATATSPSAARIASTRAACPRFSGRTSPGRPITSAASAPIDGPSWFPGTTRAGVRSRAIERHTRSVAACRYSPRSPTNTTRSYPAPSSRRTSASSQHRCTSPTIASRSVSKGTERTRFLPAWTHAQGSLGPPFLFARRRR